ncbi:S-adenosyl-L-methionine-dependent methyltransferase [Xylariales sp. PMI_506]|nr:S-adenosyl-L-methionine-dependent methyltransferase [Xylariales sp. PMI_506]
MASLNHNGTEQDQPYPAEGITEAPAVVDEGKHDADQHFGFSAEAMLHFSQFPVDQYLPDSAFNPQVPQLVQTTPVISTQITGGDGEDHLTMDAPATLPVPLPTPAASVLQPRPSAAQWSMDSFNPFVPSIFDMELDREPSGASVVEEGAILGESGRTYHGYKGNDSAYLLPNDPAEQDRLDLQHAMLTYLWDGRLALAQLPRAPRLVLDIATGTGIWALEFARANPTSFVVGTDLSKIQPVPDVPNCLFERMDCEDDWMWSYKYDYIHARMITLAIRNPKRLIRQAFEYLNPGGWLEINDAVADLVSEEGSEADERVETSKLKQWWTFLSTGAYLNGVDTNKVLKYEQWFVEAGFTDVKVEKFKVPSTPWPKDPKAKRVGQWMHANYLSGLRGVGFKMLRLAGMSPTGIEEFIEAVRNELQYDNIRGYTPVYAVYARKPFEHEILQRG